VHFRVGDKALVYLVLDPKIKLELITPFLEDCLKNVRDPNEKLEVTPFLEDGLATVKNLVQRIMNNESRLR
jgi:hypothetical protein